MNPRPAALNRIGAAPTRTLAAYAAFALAGGALAALALDATAPLLRADRALILSGALALPGPLLVLLWLPSPPAAALRRALGESAAARLDATARLIAWTAAAGLCAPLGALAVGLGADAASAAAWADIQRLALCLGLGAICGTLAASALCAWSLHVIGADRSETFARLAGGGTYGPAIVAPLLYAPALGYALGLAPVGLATAFWAGLPTPPPVASLAGAAGMLTLIYALAARARMRALAPVAHAGWLRVEEALATPFAYDRARPEPPAWLRWPARAGRADALVRHLGRAWVRRHPAPAAMPVALSTGLAVLIGASAASAGALALPLALGAIGASIGAASALRVAAQPAHEPELDASARLCGAGDDAIAAARRSLGVGLGLPALVGALALAWIGHSAGGAGVIGAAAVAAGPLGAIAGVAAAATAEARWSPQTRLLAARITQASAVFVALWVGAR